MTQEKNYIDIPEKGTIEDVEHAIACAEQAAKRADKDWLKQGCLYRRDMLLRQLNRMKNEQARG